MEEEGCVGKLLPGSNSYRLYFKGLKREETRGCLAGFGVAICDQEDNILFQMKGSLHDSSITALEAELMALKRGLAEAVSLGITHHCISIYCDHHQVFELVMGRSVPAKDNMAMLMDDVQRIRQELKSSIPVLLTGIQSNVAYKLAMETIATEITIGIPLPAHNNNTCGKCFDNDFEAEDMFSVASCGHQFCNECVKVYIQIKLLEGRNVPRCPHNGCKSKLNIRSCAHLLTPKQRATWEQRIKEYSMIPVTKRFHYPDPEISYDFDLARALQKYKKMWRHCEKCQHMIELSDGSTIHVTCCMCGYSFCYICGAEWKHGGCIHRERITCTCPEGEMATLVCFGICFLFCLCLFLFT